MAIRRETHHAIFAPDPASGKPVAVAGHANETSAKDHAHQHQGKVALVKTVSTNTWPTPPRRR
jgi:hypothetical protein